MRQLFFISFSILSFAAFSQEKPAYKFGLSLVGEYPAFKDHMPLAIQGDYFFGKAFFGSAIVSYFPKNEKFNSSWRNLSVSDNNFRISILGGTRLGKTGKFEIAFGYTGLITDVNVQDHMYNYYKVNAQGLSINHLLTLNTGYKFIIKDRYFIKPEISLNYKLGTNTRYSTYNYESYNGYDPSDVTPTGILENFTPMFRLGFGILLGK